jgi:hypothetical protein
MPTLMSNESTEKQHVSSVWQVAEQYQAASNNYY